MVIFWIDEQRLLRDKDMKKCWCDFVRNDNISIINVGSNSGKAKKKNIFRAYGKTLFELTSKKQKTLKKKNYFVLAWPIK